MAVVEPGTQQYLAGLGKASAEILVETESIQQTIDSLFKEILDLSASESEFNQHIKDYSVNLSDKLNILLKELEQLDQNRREDAAQLNRSIVHLFNEFTTSNTEMEKLNKGNSEDLKKLMKKIIDLNGKIDRSTLAIKESQDQDHKMIQTKLSAILAAQDQLVNKVSSFENKVDKESSWARVELVKQNKKIKWSVGLSGAALFVILFF
ncbi:hypothetical protein [Jeotgalibacillus proteolyticus]|uniref:hypothetical protein n=1 Tax=Jeotgalibacillus proteolyticus TaxID=2082395 RepID=UPI003CF5CF92